MFLSQKRIPGFLHHHSQEQRHGIHGGFSHDCGALTLWGRGDAELEESWRRAGGPAGARLGPVESAGWHLHESLLWSPGGAHPPPPVPISLSSCLCCAAYTLVVTVHLSIPPGAGGVPRAKNLVPLLFDPRATRECTMDELHIRVLLQANFKRRFVVS